MTTETFDAQIERVFNNQNRNSSLSLLITGLGPNEWSALAEKISSLVGIVGKKKNQSGNPDFTWLEPLKKKKTITIDQVREILRRIGLTKHELNQKVILIPQANLMNKSAQNSLLKALEEPPRACFFVLGAEFKNQLLPTVVSRCRHLNGRSVNEKGDTERGETVYEEDLHSLYLDMTNSGVAGTAGRMEKIFKDKPQKAVDFLKLVILEERRKMRKNISEGNFPLADRRLLLIKDFAENLRELESGNHAAPKSILQLVAAGIALLD